MDERDCFIDISEEIVASWFDGTLSPEEDDVFMSLCLKNTDVMQVLDANDQIGEYYEGMLENGLELPSELYFDFDLPAIEDYHDTYDEFDSGRCMDINEESYSSDGEIDDTADDYDESGESMPENLFMI